MRQFGRKDVHTYTNTPFAWAKGQSGKTVWEILAFDPNLLAKFGTVLAMANVFHPVLGVYPYDEELTTGNRADHPLLVDIGGGRGHAMLEIKKAYPGLAGRLILQERQEVLESIAEDELPGVEKMTHDFFTAQPVKYAQVYYLRRVFHDYQDAEAKKILEAIMPAMAPDSRILISDMLLPEPVTAEDAAAVGMDLMMMVIGGKERTKADWNSLVGSAGLELVKFWQTEKTGTLAIVECRLPGI